jgi:hypothetical protein
MQLAIQEIVAHIRTINSQFLYKDGKGDTEAIAEDITSTFDERAQRQVIELYNAYINIQLTLEKTVLSSRIVNDYVKKQAKRKAGMKAVVKFGLGITAAYMGASLAHREHERRSM